MLKSKIVLFAAASVFCTGLAVAQTADEAGPHQWHHPDFAALHKSACEDRQAGAAARLAFVEVKLGLTDAQKPLFAKWRQAVLDNAAKQKATCLAEAPKGDPRDHKEPTVIEREAHEEAALQARLETLKTTRPALQAFYDSLSDTQKEGFNHLHRHGGHGGWGGDHPSNQVRPQ